MKPLPCHERTAPAARCDSNARGADACELSPQAQQIAERQAQAEARLRSADAGRDYVRDGADAQLLATMRAVIDSDPALKDAPFARNVHRGRVSADDIRQLQAYAQKKGYDVGSTGVDGKFGYRTNGALQRMLHDRGHAGTPAPAGAQVPTRSGSAPAGAQVPTRSGSAPAVPLFSVGGILMHAPPRSDGASQRFHAQRYRGDNGQTYSRNTGFGPKVEARDTHAQQRSAAYADLKAFAEANGTLDGSFATPKTSLEQDAANLNRIVDAGRASRNTLLAMLDKATPAERAAVMQADAELQSKVAHAAQRGVNTTEEQFNKQQSLFMERLYQEGRIGRQLGEQNRAFMEISQMTDRAAVNMRLKFGTPAIRDAGEKAMNESPFNPQRGSTFQQRALDPAVRGMDVRTIKVTSWRDDRPDGAFATITEGAARKMGLPDLPVWDD